MVVNEIAYALCLSRFGCKNVVQGATLALYSEIMNITHTKNAPTRVIHYPISREFVEQRSIQDSVCVELKRTHIQHAKTNAGKSTQQVNALVEVIKWIKKEMRN